MRKVVLSVICAGVFALAGSAVLASELEANFEEAVCDYFQVKQAQVDAVRAFGLSDEDIPVVFHVAKRGKTTPERIAELRARGDSWSSLVQARNLSLEIFYIPISGNIDSFTYGPILDQYRTVPAKQWHRMPMSDADVINLVNLKLVASGFDYNIFEVMALRDSGKGFVQICHEVKEAKDVLLAARRAEHRSVANAGL